MAKNLIIYYSRVGENYVEGTYKVLTKGNTKYVAEYIQQAVGGDLFEVKPVKDYSPVYRTCVEEVKEQIKDDARPELQEYLSDISAYDNIFLCGPDFCGRYPYVMYSLTDRLDFTGKKVMMVVTKEGSHQSRCVERYQEHLKGTPVYGETLDVHGASAKDSQKEIADWARSQVE